MNLEKWSRSGISLQKKLAQLLAVDMQKLQGSLWCYSNLSPRMIQPSFDAQWLCMLHSHCANKSTYADRWSLDGSLAGACCMSTAGSWLSFFCSVYVYPIHPPLLNLVYLPRLQHWCVSWIVWVQGLFGGWCSSFFLSHPDNGLVFSWCPFLFPLVTCLKCCGCWPLLLSFLVI